MCDIFVGAGRCVLCVDINECHENRDICLHGRCINRPGRHQCVCNVGYQPAPDGTFCVGQFLTSTSQCRRSSTGCSTSYGRLASYTQQLHSVSVIHSPNPNPNSNPTNPNTNLNANPIPTSSLLSVQGYFSTSYKLGKHLSGLKCRRISFDEYNKYSTDRTIIVT